MVDILHRMFSSSFMIAKFTTIIAMMIKDIYVSLKQDVPDNIISKIEQSAGIRYFICDDCHDAQIENVEFESDCLTLKLDTEGMLGCLNIEGNNCSIMLNTFNSSDVKKLLVDFKKFERVFWLHSEIEFENGDVFFILELQWFNKHDYKNLNYKFKISDIKIESVQG